MKTNRQYLYKTKARSLGVCKGISLDNIQALLSQLDDEYSPPAEGNSDSAQPEKPQIDHGTD
jgi:hypothetical protein